MDNASYTTLTRQSGLLREMQSVANNIANSATTGYRSQNVIFSEFVKALEPGDPSLSMATANTHSINLIQGGLTQTNGTFDFAIEGEGFFMVEGPPQGPLLTRAGSFTPNEAGELVTPPDGMRLLDLGGAPIFAPPPDAANISVASDGTLSADGRPPLTQIGLFLPTDPTDLQYRDGGVRFEAPGGTEPVIEGAAILQGYIEGSNVDPVGEIAA